MVKFLEGKKRSGSFRLGERKEKEEGQERAFIACNIY